MQIVGRSCSSLQVAYRHRLAHGEDPYRAALERGYVIQRAYSSYRTSDDIVLELIVGDLTADIATYRPTRLPADYATPADSAPPITRQRIAAYTIVLSDRGVLATQFSSKTGAAGQWGFPGGGVEPREEPAVTVVREAEEETAQRLVDPMLLDVQSDHWIGRAPHGVLEDFHAVRLVFTGRVDDPTEAEVLDRGGTTADARWVPLEQWRSLGWTGGARALLEKHLDSCITGFQQKQNF